MFTQCDIPLNAQLQGKFVERIEPEDHSGDPERQIGLFDTVYTCLRILSECINDKV